MKKYRVIVVQEVENYYQVEVDACSEENAYEKSLDEMAEEVFIEERVVKTRMETCEEIESFGGLD